MVSRMRAMRDAGITHCKALPREASRGTTSSCMHVCESQHFSDAKGQHMHSVGTLPATLNRVPEERISVAFWGEKTHKQSPPLNSWTQERKISPKRKFSGRTSRGHPGVIRADIPTQNFGQGAPNPGKTSIWARTSMTRRCGRP